MKNRLQIFFGLIVIIAIIVWSGVFSSASPADSNLHIYFLNVGQGDSEYIKNPDGSDILIDGGPDGSVLAELGKVMTLGDRKIDLVVLTHPHADHLTGLIDVIDRFEIGEVWTTGVEYPSSAYDTFKDLLKQKNIVTTIVQKGKVKNFGSENFSVLTPLSNLQNSKIDNVNSASIVTELNYDKFSALFLGDAEKDLQNQILPQLKSTNIIKVAHHGSKNALNEDLYKITRPEVAVVSVGAKNTYGHPHAEVTNFLKSLAIQIYRTDQNGTIEISSDGINWWKK